MSARRSGTRPSQWFDDLGALAAYCLDEAVTTIGAALEDAQLETEEVGEGKTRRSVPKYTLKQLLDPDFYLPGLIPRGPMIIPRNVLGLMYDEVD